MGEVGGDLGRLGEVGKLKKVWELEGREGWGGQLRRQVADLGSPPPKPATRPAFDRFGSPAGSSVCPSEVSLPS